MDDCRTIFLSTQATGHSLGGSRLTVAQAAGTWHGVQRRRWVVFRGSRPARCAQPLRPGSASPSRSRGRGRRRATRQQRAGCCQLRVIDSCTGPLSPRCACARRTRSVASRPPTIKPNPGEQAPQAWRGGEQEFMNAHKWCLSPSMYSCIRRPAPVPGAARSFWDCSDLESAVWGRSGSAPEGPDWGPAGPESGTQTALSRARRGWRA
eukprot:scaffold603_cov404-Prasinococcus_capsulatus_cf.AAC.24